MDQRGAGIEYSAPVMPMRVTVERIAADRVGGLSV